MKRTIRSLLLLSAVICVTPASANYFSQTGSGTHPNIGSAANPAPQPVLQQFLLFFDFENSGLTPEASQIVALAVTAAHNTGTARISIVGHTDGAGSLNYNQELSERRAIAVKTEIVRLGMDAVDIVTVHSLPSEPLALTNGAREPQNRRGVIDLDTVSSPSLL
jgi:OmpA-OmpF porin, OOP family